MNRLFLPLLILLFVACNNTPNESSDETVTPQNNVAVQKSPEPTAVAVDSFPDQSLEWKKSLAQDFLAKKGKMKQEALRLNLKLRLLVYSRSGRVDDILFNQKNGDLTKKNDFVAASKLVDPATGAYTCSGVYTLVNGAKKTKKKYEIEYFFTGSALNYKGNVTIK